MRSTCVSPAAQAAWSLLAAYGAAPPKLRQEQLPKVVPQTCQVRIFFGIFWIFGEFLKISKPDLVELEGEKGNEAEGFSF